MKRFALPDRFPFDTSDGNFVIANETQVTAKGMTSTRSLEKSTGTRAGDRESLRDRQAQRQRTEKRVSVDESETTSSNPLRGLKAQESAGTDAKAGTLSASASGGSVYIYSITGMLLAEYSRNNDTVPVKDYIYVGGRLLAEYKPLESKTYFYTPDQINSTRIVTDDTGTVVYSAAHDPYGGIQQTWANSFDPTPEFSGKERDGESQLDYFGARYYDKAQYRFISADPVIRTVSSRIVPREWNRYCYCGNNPVSYLDPDGNASFYCKLVNIFFKPWGDPALWNMFRGNGYAVSSAAGPLNITILKLRDGNYALNVVWPVNITIVRPNDRRWGGIMAALERHTYANVMWHEMYHLFNLEERMENKLAPIEASLTSAEVTPELIDKIYKLTNEAIQEVNEIMDGWLSFLGFAEWYFNGMISFVF